MSVHNAEAAYPLQAAGRVRAPALRSLRPRRVAVARPLKKIGLTLPCMFALMMVAKNCIHDGSHGKERLTGWLRAIPPNAMGHDTASPSFVNGGCPDHIANKPTIRKETMETHNNFRDSANKLGLISSIGSTIPASSACFLQDRAQRSADALPEEFASALAKAVAELKAKATRPGAHRRAPSCVNLCLFSPCSGGLKGNPLLLKETTM